MSTTAEVPVSRGRGQGGPPGRGQGGPPGRGQGGPPGRQQRQAGRPRPAGQVRARQGRPGGSSFRVRKRRPSEKQLAAARKQVRPGATFINGFLWLGFLVAAAELGPVAVALLFAPIAVLAAVTGARSLGVDDPLTTGLAVGAPVIVALISIGGASSFFAAVFLAAAVVAAIVVLRPGVMTWRAGLAVLAPTLAAGSAVAGLVQGVSEGFTLFAAVCLYDVASFCTADWYRKRSAFWAPLGGPVGVVWGVVTVVVLSVFVGAVVVPPFTGGSPWVLCALVAVFAPAGIGLSGWIVKGRKLPALRRIDSLALAGPAWVAGVALLLHH